MLAQAGAMRLASKIQLRTVSIHAARARAPLQESGAAWISKAKPSTFAGDALGLNSSNLRRDCRASTFLIKSALNTSTSPENSEDGGGPFGFGTTRLGRIIANRQRDFTNKFNTVRKKFPLKIFLLLLGYYSANALATILGQTGDWDVLAAGILVALIEGVGYLMYRLPSVLGVRGKELIVYVNFWKSGFSFGLFVDAFKLGS
ncbi:hypothetical protein MPTK1_7g13370 [Marchantia polymorpha subsp. ruderalis]|uniref:Ycf20-like protein n=2 Tax=Marchantia polymorpha TaxID=3197 RepID=A0AAF6BZ53_MARPO|nr:hypothetical protein MARPO_0009s0023 [Marchantia polymorpha]BBN17287.1 hypothetical protein Mp_7g13370 [Marchantia polymorpha subsp. ruderalis]|eukprot:PTQ46892.1 hypothetical protein MARPO_0009s0023 [Marchantia polymorpha]